MFVASESLYMVLSKHLVRGLINFKERFLKLAFIRVPMITLFVRRTAQGCTLLLLYVDDMIISGNDVTGIIALKSCLMRHFKMKDLGHLTYFLGLVISRIHNGTHIHQMKYAEDLLSLSHLTDSKISETPMELNSKLRKEEGNPLPDPTMYRRLVGSLIYLTMTRPDTSLMQSILLANF